MFARGISWRKVSTGFYSRPRTTAVARIFACKGISPRRRAPPTPRFTATTVAKEKFKERVVNLERKYEKLEERLVFL